MPVAAPPTAASPIPPPNVLAGVLVHLADWLTSGCPRAGRQAALCLSRLAATDHGDPCLSQACDSLLNHLELPPST